LESWIAPSKAVKTMSIREAEDALSKLESSQAVCDPEKARRYFSLVKEFLRKRNSYCTAFQLRTSELFVAVDQLFEPIPQDIAERVSSVTTLHNWPRFCTFAVEQHLKYLIAKELLPIEEKDLMNIYEPLFDILLEGGDFWPHHGNEICISDIGTVLIRPEDCE
jgi:hypothetical protein